MAEKTINISVVREIALSLPDVTESTLHGVPSFKLRGKLLACPAIHHSADPDTLAVRIDVEQRGRLITAEPDLYYVTEHYANYPMVLVRMSRITRSALKDLLDMAWRILNSPAKATGRQARNPDGGKEE